MNELEMILMQSAAWNDSMLFGQASGECGNCGHSLDSAEKEHGLCEDCQDEYFELLDEGLVQ